MKCISGLMHKDSKTMKDTATACFSDLPSEVVQCVFDFVSVESVSIQQLPSLLTHANDLMIRENNAELLTVLHPLFRNFSFTFCDDDYLSVLVFNKLVQTLMLHDSQHHSLHYNISTTFKNDVAVIFFVRNAALLKLANDSLLKPWLTFDLLFDQQFYTHNVADQLTTTDYLVRLKEFNPLMLELARSVSIYDPTFSAYALDTVIRECKSIKSLNTSMGITLQTLYPLDFSLIPLRHLILSSATLQGLSLVLQCKTIEVLDLAYFNCEWEVWNTASCSGSVRTVRLYQCTCSRKMLRSILATFPRLQTLEIVVTKVAKGRNEKLFKGEAKAIAGSTSLRRLVLNNAVLDQSFCQELAMNNKLCEVALVGCQLSDDHVSPFLESKTITNLDVRNNAQLCTARLIARHNYDTQFCARMAISF